MLKLSRLADYAIVILVRLGEQEGVVTSPSLAVDTGVPEPTVAKVLKLLSTHGFVLSQRGAKGGYRLARPLSQISVASVITTVDGRIALTACVDGGGCDNGVTCGLCGSWDTINQAIRSTLESISLEDMRLNRTARAASQFLAKTPEQTHAGGAPASREIREGA